MKKNTKTMISAAAAVLVIAVLCVCIVTIKGSKPKEVMVTEVTNITSLSFFNGTDELSFLKDEAGWRYEPDNSFPLDQRYLAEMEGTLSNLTGLEADKNPEDLKYYGLEEPVYRVTAGTADGGTVNLLIGNLASEDSCYVMKEGENIVYAVPTELGLQASRTLYSLIEVERFPQITADQIREICITKHGETGRFVKNGETWTSGEDKSPVEDGSSLDAVAEAITKLENEDCVNYKVQDKQLRNYGLDEPAGILTYGYEEGGGAMNLTLIVGKTDPEGNYYYTKRERSNAVNRIAKSLIEPCLFSSLD